MGVAASTLHGARVCIVPHPENNYLPLALRRGPLAFASSLLIITKILALFFIALLPSTAELSTITSERIVQLTNEERKEQGLQELKENPSLAQAAQDKANDMLANDYFAHISPAGVTPWFWMQKYNYSYQVAGENLAIDFVQAEDVVSAWLASPSHKENIMHPDYTETGVAVAIGDYQGGSSTVVVHMFGLPAGARRPNLAAAGEVKTSTQPATISPAIPSPTPPVAAAENPPAIPTLTTAAASKVIRDVIDLNINGEPSARVTILVNNQPRSTAVINRLGVVKHNLDLSHLPDGDIVIKIYAENQSGVKSGTSEPLLIQKDATGPELNQEDLMFLVSPATDHLSAAIYLSADNFAGITISTDQQSLITIAAPVPRIVAIPLLNKPLQIQAFDNMGNVSTTGHIALMPSFFDRVPANTSPAPRLASQTARQVAGVMAALVIILLSLAILIKINIQHPRMIIQACLLFILAVTLLFSY